MRWFMHRFARRRRYDELAESIREHLEHKTADLIDQGMTPEQATRAAHRSFGNKTRIEERSREVWTWPRVESFAADVRFALRQLRHAPAYTCIVLFTLTLGIGAALTVFSEIDAVLLRPLAFPNSEQLTRLWDTYGTPGNMAPVSYPNFEDWRAWNHSFSGLAAFADSSYVLTGVSSPIHLDGIAASADFFKVLGVQPILGRRFRSQEDRPFADGGSDAVILSYTVWQEVFAGDAKIIGRHVLLDRQPFVIVGVAPKGMNAQLGGIDAQFWTTLAPIAEVSPASPKPLSQERQMSFLGVIGRLKPGVTLSQAQADMQHVAENLTRTYPTDDLREGVYVESLQSSITGNVRPMILALFAAVCIVLLIACANVGVLTLVRTVGRQREMSIRIALGSGRLRIARQMLVEFTMLAFAGAAFGLGLALFTSHGMLAILGVTWVTQVPLDSRLLGFAFAASMASIVIFGLAPLLQVWKRPPLDGLKGTGSHAGSEGRTLPRLRKLLVGAQTALAILLLSLAGLVFRSLLNLEHVSPGFDASHVVAFPVDIPPGITSEKERPSFFEEVLRQVRSLPGVESAAAGGAMPFGGISSNTVLDNVAGHAIPQAERRGITFMPVTPGYFATLRIPLKTGRFFSAQDTATSEPAVIINEAAAHRYFGEVNPVGQQVEPVMWDGAGSATKMRTVVGVVGDVKYDGPAAPSNPEIYWPLAQIPSSSTMYLALRTSAGLVGIAPEIRTRLKAVDKTLPLYDLRLLSADESLTLAQPRSNALLMISFAAAALLLTMVGVYGSLSHTVARRTHEIGIRMTLGARRRDIMRAVLTDSLTVVFAGLAIGIPIAVAGTRLVRTLLFGISATDPATFLASALILIAVCVIASIVPALRAVRVDPVRAIRAE